MYSIIKQFKFIFILLTVLSVTNTGLSQASKIKGSELLDRFKNAILSDNTQFKQVVFVGDNTVYSDKAPGGEVEMGTRKAYNFANQSRRTDFKSPVGQITIYLEDGKAAKIVKGRKTPLRDYEEQQLKNGLHYHYLNIALHSNNFSPEYTGNEEIEGTSYNKLEFTIQENIVTYLLHPETYYPYYVKFMQYSAEADKEVQVTEHYYEWKIKDEIAVAFKKDTYEQGKISGEFTYTSVSFD